MLAPGWAQCPILYADYLPLMYFSLKLSCCCCRKYELNTQNGTYRADTDAFIAKFTIFEEIRPGRPGNLEVGSLDLKIAQTG